MAINIIVRRVKGGCRARYNLKGRRFGPIGRTFSEAVGLLVIEKPELLALSQVQYDPNDLYTQNYINGKQNPREMPSVEIRFELLPHAKNIAEAKLLELDQLPLPRAFKGALRSHLWALGRTSTLGDFCACTESELIALQVPFRKLGPKRMQMLKDLLAHYNLALKKPKRK